MEEKIDVSNNTPRYTDNNNNNVYDKYAQYNTKQLIDVIEHLKEQNGILKQENRDLDFDRNNTWKDMYYYRDEFWQEQQDHRVTYFELIETKEKVKELEKEIFVSNKIPHLFWKYILLKSDILTFMFEIICG